MNLFFIALLPPGDVQAEVTAFKETARDRFGSGHALRSPPHITLVPPFRTNRSDFSALGTFAAGCGPFLVQLRHFDRFGQRVIFVNVAATDVAATDVATPDVADVVAVTDVVNPAGNVVTAPLRSLQATLATFCHAQFGIEPDARPFHPHMTVAFRDLTRAQFPAAWAYFSAIRYERTFLATGLTLLRHAPAGWQVVTTFPFGPGQT